MSLWLHLELRDGESHLPPPVYILLLQARGGIRPDATMKRVRATLLLVLATSALAACRQLRQDNVTGKCPSLSHGCLRTRLNAMTGQLRSFCARSHTALPFEDTIHAVYNCRVCITECCRLLALVQGVVPQRRWCGAHARHRLL